MKEVLQRYFGRYIALFVVSIALAIFGTFTFHPLRASAQCGWLDPTCHPSKWNRPPITFPTYPSGGGESCLAVMTDKKYKFNITNKARSLVQYKINNKLFNLQPNYTAEHTYTKAYGTNSCNVQTYPDPIVYYYGKTFNIPEKEPKTSPNYTFIEYGNSVILVLKPTNLTSSTCSTNFSPATFRGLTGKVAFSNEWNIPVTVILYHPNSKSIYDRYIVPPGQGQFLGNNIIVGDDWGICFENKPSSSGFVNNLGNISTYNPDAQGSPLFII